MTFTSIHINQKSIRNQGFLTKAMGLFVLLLLLGAVNWVVFAENEQSANSFKDIPKNEQLTQKIQEQNNFQQMLQSQQWRPQTDQHFPTPKFVVQK